MNYALNVVIAINSNFNPTTRCVASFYDGGSPFITPVTYDIGSNTALLVNSMSSWMELCGTATYII